MTTDNYDQMTVKGNSGPTISWCLPLCCVNIPIGNGEP